MIKVTAPVRIDISAGWSDADPFRSEFGGAVLNAAISLRVAAILNGGKLVSSLQNVPANSGLGTSGALRTVYLVAANPSLIKDKDELIKRVHVFENAIVGQRAGFQDQTAAIYGGVNYWEFRKKGSIKKVEISKKAARHLFDRLVLVFSGRRHLSANIHEEVFSKRNYPKHIVAINKMKEIAKKMVSKLTKEEVMKDLINESWELQKSLHRGMETFYMKKIQKIADGKYLAVRATGAGGGGCMLFYTNQKRKLLFTLRRKKKQIPGMRVLPFEFDYEGIKLQK